VTSSGHRNILLGAHFLNRQDPVPTVLDFESQDSVPPGEECELFTFTVGDSLPMIVLPWPFRPFAFAIPAKRIHPITSWTLVSMRIYKEEQVMIGRVPLEGLIGYPLCSYSGPTGSELRIRVCNEANVARRFRIALLGSALRLEDQHMRGER
jgi:hypothetical protein